MKFTRQVINILRLDFAEGERPEWTASKATTVVVTTAIAEVDYDTGEMLRLRIEGYRKERPSSAKAHTFGRPAQGLPEDLHDLYRDLQARQYDKAEPLPITG